VALSYTTVRGVLSGAFPRKIVQGVLGAMAGQGMVKPGRSAVFSPDTAAVAMMASALHKETGAGAALSAALRSRDWRTTAPAPNRKMALGYQMSSFSDVRVIRILCAQIYLKQPTPWWISAVECIGGGLCFSRGDYDGRVPESIKRDWIAIPQWLINEFARHHGVATEQQRQMNALLLARVTKSLRPEQIEEAAE
jgi:hypothetical protein